MYRPKSKRIAQKYSIIHLKASPFQDHSVTLEEGDIPINHYWVTTDQYIVVLRLIRSE